MRRSKLELLRRSTVTVGECVETMERLRAVVSAEILRLPGSLCHDLAGRDPQHIQQVLDGALRSALERLNRPENYFCSNP
jgi:hypothetical protein